MLNKIFISKGNGKNLNERLFLKFTPSGYEKVNYEKSRSIKLLELFSRKFSNDYIDKSSLLLYTSKNTKNYSLKRKKLKNTMLNYDENNNLCITLSKLNKLCSS